LSTAPDCTAEKLETFRAKLLMLYEPGVHAGSDRIIGPPADAVNRISAVTCRRAALAAVKITS
jgi:hypothetical protein